MQSGVILSYFTDISNKYIYSFTCFYLPQLDYFNLVKNIGSHCKICFPSSENEASLI